MSSYEFTGKSVKEAIARACEELNLDEELLEVEVLEESTRGFLGIVGQRDARVRVRKRDVPRQASKAPQSRPRKLKETRSLLNGTKSLNDPPTKICPLSLLPHKLIRPPLTRP